MTQQPLVSIVTPAYNTAAYIEETAGSVLAQDYPNLEYVVVDDGSADDTLARLERVADPRLRLVRQANAGEQRAVNRGVAEARGEIIGIVNADDPLLPGLVSAAVERLGQDPRLAGVYPDWLKIDGDGRVLEAVLLREYDYTRMLKRHLCDIGPGCLFRRTALNGAPPRDARFRYSGDFQQWLRLGLHNRFARLPRVLATWRQHAAGTSQAGLSAALAADKVAIVEDLFARADLPPEVRAQRAEALSAAHFTAACLALHNPLIPGRRHMWRSLLAKPRWRPPDLPERRRTWRLVLFALGLPTTRPLVDLYQRWRGGAFETAAAPGPHYSDWTDERDGDWTGH
jgi:glycosyltransferase involved in cell wall biosynthesis